MKTSCRLTLQDAQASIDAALAEAVHSELAVTVALCDAGGQLITLVRMDGAPPVSAQLAPAKARTCVLTGNPSGLAEEMVNKGRVAALTMGVVTMEGGIPIIVGGDVVGAVGVSGATSTDDARVATAAVNACTAHPAAAAA